tara:strand:+ start:147 stop:419 length:273 start_codon:yes stop_codon:yes gene_type:complete
MFLAKIAFAPNPVFWKLPSAFPLPSYKPNFENPSTPAHPIATIATEPLVVELVPTENTEVVGSVSFQIVEAVPAALALYKDKYLVAPILE